MIRLTIILSITVILVSACATTKVPQPTGGSRADGVVELSYEVGMFEKPQVNWSRADRSADGRCQAWGYSNAERFGGVVSECQARNAHGNCLREFVTVSYQCTGDR